MRILLVNPGYRQIYTYKKPGSSVLPSLGLLSIASVVRETGFGVDLVDYELEGVGIKDKLSLNEYLFAGITGVSTYFPAMYNIAKSIKDTYPSLPVIAGGPHASLCYEDLLKYDVFDAAILGEGEEIISNLIKGYRKGISLEEFFEKSPHVATRKTSRPLVHAFVRDLDSLPMLAYDFVDWGQYKASVHRKGDGKFATLMTSRGCPFKCRYCKTPFEPPYRYQSVAKVLQQVEYLVSDIGVDYLQIWDDNFTLNRKRAISIAKGIAPFNIEWSINTRPDCVDEELLDILRQGGCDTIFYGVESSDPQTLKKLNRDIKLGTLQRAFHITKAADIRTVAGCILGLPSDTPELIFRNIDFVRSLEPDFVHFSIYSANPQTYLWNEAVDEDLFPARMNWMECKRYDGPPMGMPTCNPYLTRKELQDILKYAYSLFPSCAVRGSDEKTQESLKRTELIPV